MNRKLIVVTAMLFMLSFTSWAQIGVQLGYNFAKIKGIESGSADIKNQSAITAGIFYEKDIIPFIDLRLGLNYSPKGSHLALGDNYSKISLNYIELPILAKVKVGPLYALGGIYGAYAINGNVSSRLEILGVTVTSDEAINFEDEQINRIDFGMKFGAGLQFGLGPVKIFAQGDYSFGLMNINDYEDGDELKNNVLGIHAGAILSF